jgi:hypothetical protein
MSLIDGEGWGGACGGWAAAAITALVVVEG